MRRAIVTLIAGLSAFLLAAGLASPAIAQEKAITTPERTATERSEVTTQRSAPLPAHDVRWNRRGQTAREGVFWSRGKVVSWKGRTVKLQTAKNRNGKWTGVKTTKTSKRQGVWSFKFKGRIGRHYRVLIPKANWARATKVYVGKIVRQY